MNANLTALALSALLVSGAARAAPNALTSVQEPLLATTVDATRMQPFAAMLNELSQRRRRVVYTGNPLSLFDGAAVDLVQVGAGNLSLRRRDLVTGDLLPVTLARVYDSRRAGAGDFGRGGWALSLAERLHLDGANAQLVLANGRAVTLVPDADQWRPQRAEPGVPDLVERAGPGLWRVRGADGDEALFAPRGDGRTLPIVERRDRFGNRVHFEYDPEGRLLRVASARRSLRIARHPDGRIQRVTDGAGRTVRYEYDAGGFLVRVLDPAGHPWHYDYDAAGRLARAVAPSGPVDLRVIYDAAGRVTRVEQQSRPTTFVYGQALAHAADLEVTRVVTPGRSDRLFGHDADGVTVLAQNAAGPVSRLTLDAAGRPRTISHDDVPQAAFRYDASRRLDRLQRRVRDVWVERRFVYTDAGLTAIADAQGRPLVAVERRADGRVSVQRGERLWQHTLSPVGGVVQLAFPGGEHYALTNDASGRVTSVVDSLGQTVSLAYSATGRLVEAVFPGGERHHYRYDGLGLRTHAQRSTGHALRYDYTPAGRIYRYEVTGAAGDRQITAHRVDDAQRLVAVEGDGFRVAIDYAEGDRVRSIANGALRLRFGYDALGRLASVANGDEIWRHDYAAAPSDLVLRAETRRAFPAARGADAAAAIYDHLYLRRPPNLYGAARLDVALARFAVDGEFGIALPGDDVRHALQAIGLIGVDGRALASAARPDAHAAFESPSNLLFVPPEFWSLNCIICFGVHPHGLSPARAALPPTLMSMAKQLERVCDVDTNPPVDCTLDVSGLPVYLCDTTRAQVGAVLSPTTLPGQFIDWSTNNYLVPVPVGASGPHAFVRATSPGGNTPSAQGAVTASYSRQGVSCSSTRTVAVIANDPVDYSQVIDLDACPERQQDTARPYDVDGCSISTLVADFLLPGDAQDPVGGAYHAPGQPTTFGVAQGAIPFGTGPVPLPCNLHDVCYQTCGNGRDGCDSTFYANMSGVCALSYPATCPFTFGSSACLNFELEKIRCALGSSAIYQFVNSAAAGPYRARQVQYCDCCPP